MFTCIRYCGKVVKKGHTYTRWLYLPVHVIVERVVAGKGKQHPKARPQRKEHLICCIHPHLSTQHSNSYSHPPTPVNTVRPSSLTSTHTCQYGTAIITHIHPHLLIQYGHHHFHPHLLIQYGHHHFHPHLSIQYGHHHSHPPTPVNTVRPSSLTFTHTCQYSTAIITHIHPHLLIQHGQHHSHPLTPVNKAWPS